MKKPPTEKQIYNFVRDHYYCDSYGRGCKREKWQPFENWSDEDIEEQISNDVNALNRFLEAHYGN